MDIVRRDRPTKKCGLAATMGFVLSVASIGCFFVYGSLHSHMLALSIDPLTKAPRSLVDSVDWFHTASFFLSLPALGLAIVILVRRGGVVGLCLTGFAILAFMLSTVLL